MPKSSPSKETVTDSRTATSAAYRPQPQPKNDHQPTSRGSTFNRRKGVKFRPSLTISRFRHSQRLHRVPDPRRHAHGAQRDRLRVVLVLPATHPWQFARVVPDAELPPTNGPLATPGASRIRALFA